MEPELERLEIEPAVGCDDDLAVQHAAGGQPRAKRIDELWKVAIQRLLIAALDLDIVPVPEDQCAKPIPLRFENPGFTSRQRVNAFSEHRQDRRVDRKIHTSCYTAEPDPS